MILTDLDVKNQTDVPENSVPDVFSVLSGARSKTRVSCSQRGFAFSITTLLECLFLTQGTFLQIPGGFRDTFWTTSQTSPTPKVMPRHR